MTSPTPRERLARCAERLRALEAAGTAAPWHPYTEDPGRIAYRWSDPWLSPLRTCERVLLSPNSNFDLRSTCALVLALRNAAPVLLDVLDDWIERRTCDKPWVGCVSWAPCLACRSTLPIIERLEAALGRG